MNNWFDRLVALLLLILHMPVILIIMLALLVTQGRPIFYRGVRLGKNKMPFDIYKFRTLKQGTEARLECQVLPERSGRETLFGNVMRETRIDEIPQLFNVLKGDMNLIGPRPERPSVYECIKDSIPGFEKRFEIKPGLIGPGQLLTPHGVSKEIRHRVSKPFNNRLKKRSVLFSIYLMLLTLYAILGRIVYLLEYAYQRCKGVKLCKDKRTTRRISPSRSIVYYDTGQGAILLGPLRDINDEAFAVILLEAMDIAEGNFILQRDIKKKSRLRTKKARCFGRRMSFERKDKRTGRPILVMTYEPDNEYNQYIIDKYFLKKSLL